MKHILIIDDNKTNLISAKNALSDLYKVTAVTSGMQAFKFLEKNKPDLILLDINMPDMDGYEVMENLQGNIEYNSIPIVFLTADNNAETESECLERGALDFIAKPFSPVVMRSRVSRILELEEYRKSLANRLDEKIREVSAIKSKSLQDALTGLWNRAYTEETVEKLLKKGESGALFMMDMDNFKSINDNYGHIAGDHTLKMFADTLRKYAGENDIICRIGGDEFMTYIIGNTSKSALANHAANIISDMCYNLVQCKFETNASVSIGIAQFPEDGSDFKSLYNAADKALYCVKQSGKNSYHFYSEQNAMENERSNNKVDLNYLREIMHRTDPGRGSYMLDYDNFHYVYNFIRRIVERSNRNVQLILFTLDPETGRAGDSAEVEKVVELLEHAIFTSLRRVDVSTRYSSQQVIVILLDADKDNGKMVASRIMDSYHKLYKGDLTFNYDIIQMDN